MAEKEILRILSKDPHPFVVNLLATFNDEMYIYMALECIIGGEFFTHLRNAGTFDSKSSRFYAASVALVFESLHEKDIIYRDLKPEVSWEGVAIPSWILVCSPAIFVILTQSRSMSLLNFAPESTAG